MRDRYFICVRGEVHEFSDIDAALVALELLITPAPPYHALTYDAVWCLDPRGEYSHSRKVRDAFRWTPDVPYWQVPVEIRRLAKGIEVDD